MAAIDLAGGTSEDKHQASADRNPHRDSTVVTVGELDFDTANPFTGEPQVRIVEHAWWTGVSPASLYPQLVDLMKRVWHCRRLVVDATGLGQGPASFLEHSLGRSVVEPFIFTSQSKSRLGFDLLAAVNGGRLKMYAADSSQEYQEFWRQIEQATAYCRPNRTMNFLVEPQKWVGGKNPG